MGSAMRFKWMSVSAIMVATAGFSLGQAPVLAVSSAVTAGLRWGVTVTNTYSAPVTAFAIEAGRKGDYGVIGHRILWRDLVLSGAKLEIGLPPGASTFVTLGAGGPGGIAVRNTAVIYADGTTAGDPAIIAHFLHARQQFLAELPPTIALLRAASNDPGASRASLAGEFEKRQSAGAAALVDSSGMHSSDGVSLSVLATLKDTSQSVQSEAYGLVQNFTAWQAKLEASLPKLKVAGTAAAGTP
ncbi:MAG TPA: hypothetical protein VMV31_07710 [Terriglobales bacterium]|nr:hypothetical protein [Terriglobales bacterium]